MKTSETLKHTTRCENQQCNCGPHCKCCNSSTARCWIWSILAFLLIGAIGYWLYTIAYIRGSEAAYNEIGGMKLQLEHRLGKETSNHMDMSMSDMSAMLVGKTGDALDRAFIEGMIPHHQGAIDMAKYLVNAKHPELQKLGQDIIKAQTAEIEQMKKWMQEWGYTQTGNTQTGAMMHMMPDGTMMHGTM